MDRTTLCSALHPDCPIRNVLARIGDKWSLLVIFTLDGMPSARFGELLRALPDISQKMLTVTLRMLEEDGLVTRTAYPEIPPRVEYGLTPRAQSLLPHVRALIVWAGEHMEAILEDRRVARRRR
ncbi:MAG: helix-turn-helix transcriptional regulator [Alistipes sp.]|nr:helix-turn-helix transcriptional regulator [Alistipes senegalensis]MCM1249829.1 helix-turn-helix transcriptional regulator [Alistipes sp.]